MTQAAWNDAGTLDFITWTELVNRTQEDLLVEAGLKMSKNQVSIMLEGDLSAFREAFSGGGAEYAVRTRHLMAMYLSNPRTRWGTAEERKSLREARTQVKEQFSWWT